jgi:hypothetical protein
MDRLIHGWAPPVRHIRHTCRFSGNTVQPAIVILVPSPDRCIGSRCSAAAEARMKTSGLFRFAARLMDIRPRGAY